MSVLIKGMEMPRDCEECRFSEVIDGLGCIVMHYLILRRHGQDKPSWCPLIEVPTPHGRLIDADELYEKTAEWEAQALHMVEETMNGEDKTEQHRWSVVLMERSVFKYDIEDAPTIIEAEEGEGK